MKAGFPISETIYTQLLRAYPRSHRERYGAAMVQLFRDQCRDAWTEAGNFGLLKLWLRALPDLVGSSIMERLAALKERKTMNDKLANLSSFQNYSPGKTFLKVFVPIFLFVVIVSTVVTFILPETYASTATIKVEPEGPYYFDDGKFHSDPYFVQTTFEIMRSELVLSNVVDALNLNDTWGKKYNAGEPLRMAETAEILRQRLAFVPIRNTKMISITVYDEDKDEAAALANQVAKAYQQYRFQQAKKFQGDVLRVLAQQLEAQSNQMLAATIPSDREEFSQEYELLRAKYRVAKIDYDLPSYIMVQITDPAEPGKAPVKPNKPLNITLGVFGGMALASIVGLLVLMAKSLVRRKVGAPAV